MSYKDNQDLRNTGDGGWFYAEHELFSVFAPLIGPLGVSVYMAMCRLIPLAAVDPYRQVTVRSVSVESCVSRGTADRMMGTIVRLGMVEERRGAKNRPSTYKLVSLRKVALVGIKELRSRLGVPPMDTEADGSDEEGGSGSTHDEAQTGSGGRDASKRTESGRSAAPKPADREDVPRRDTTPLAVENTLPGLPVSQKRSSVSQKRGVGVPNRGVPLIKKNEEEEFNTPLPPSHTRGDRLDSIAASAETRPAKSNDKSKSKNFPDEGLADAVAKVQRECGLADPRAKPIIEQALRTVASRLDVDPEWNAHAEAIARGYANYLGNKHSMSYPVGPRKFIAELMWLDDRKWPWDEKLLRERGRRL